MILSDTMRFKAQIANLLISNENIKKVLGVEDDREILYNFVYPYLYIPAPEESARAIITFELNTPRIDRNEFFKHSELFIRILCHRYVMRTEWGGTRVDILDSIITNELNWRDTFGVAIKLQYSRALPLTDTYYARELRFGDLKYSGTSCIREPEECAGCD